MVNTINPLRQLRIALVVDPYTVVLNQGSDHKIDVGDRLMVYSIGPEIKDPESGVSLGNLEVIKGIGHVTHVQEHMATIRSEKRVKKERSTYPGGLSSSFLLSQVFNDRQVEKTEERIPVAFQSPMVGDLVKPV